MKKTKFYMVSAAWCTPGMLAGTEPWDCQYDFPNQDYTEASSPEAAIEQVMDWLVEEMAGTEVEVSVEIDGGGKKVVYREDGEITGAWGFFEAEEIHCKVEVKLKPTGMWFAVAETENEEEAKGCLQVFITKYRPFAYRIVDMLGHVIEEENEN